MNATTRTHNDDTM